MAFEIKDLTPEQIQKGMACKSLDDFHAFIKGEGLDLDEEEAQAIFEEMYEIELSDENTKITFPKKLHVIKEVTDDEAYRNYSLAKR